MKKILIILSVLTATNGLFAQKIDYSISAGANLNYFSLKSKLISYENIPRHSIYSSDDYFININSGGLWRFY